MKSLEQCWALLAIVFIIIVIIIEAMGFPLLNSVSPFEQTLLRVTQGRSVRISSACLLDGFNRHGGGKADQAYQTHITRHAAY